MKPLTIAEHQKFFDDTGIDLEGELESNIYIYTVIYLVCKYSCTIILHK